MLNLIDGCSRTGWRLVCGVPEQSLRCVKNNKLPMQNRETSRRKAPPWLRHTQEDRQMANAASQPRSNRPGRLMLRALLLLSVSTALPNMLFAQQADAAAQVAAHLANAQHLLAEHKPDLATDEYQAVLKLSPGNLEAQGNVGVLLFFQNNCSLAVGYLSGALSLQPGAAKLRALLGVCQRREGNLQEARGNLEASLPSVTESAIRLLIENNLAELYYAEGDLELASNTTEDLLKADPHNPYLLYMIYRIHTEIADRARNVLATIAPDSAVMHRMMAEHFINEGDAANAIIQYERALEIDPKIPGVDYELGEAVLQNSKAPESLRRATGLLNKALAEDPRNAGAEAKLGTIAMIQNQPDLAANHFSRALAIQPDQLDALEGMADIASLHNDTEAAVKYLLEASRKDPMDDKLHYRLSRLYRQLNRIDESDHELKLFMDIRNLKRKTELSEQLRTSP